MKVSAFIDTMGVNIHLSQISQKNIAAVGQDLQYLGINNVRSSPPSVANTDPLKAQASLAKYQYLANLGVKFDFIIPYQVDIPAFLQNTETMEKQNPGSVIAVEGLNEVNNFPFTYNGTTYNSKDNWQAVSAEALIVQAALYKAVHNDPALTGIPVYSATGVGLPIVSLSGLADAANAHPYANLPLKIAEIIPNGFRLFRADAANSPKVETEFGAFTYPAAVQTQGYTPGVDEEFQAKIVLNQFFEGAYQGLTHSYVYELADEAAYSVGLNTIPTPPVMIENDKPGPHFGLFHSDGTPKPSAIALHNLSLLLDSPHAALTKNKIRNFSYTVTPLPQPDTQPPAAVRSLLLQQDNGDYIVALWNDAPQWKIGQSATLPLTLDPVGVNMALSEFVRSVEIFDPLTGAAIQPQATHQKTFTLSVPDHPILIVISGQ